LFRFQQSCPPGQSPPLCFQQSCPPGQSPGGADDYIKALQMNGKKQSKTVSQADSRKNENKRPLFFIKKKRKNLKNF
jgi:hypothetical protein